MPETRDGDDDCAGRDAGEDMEQQIHHAGSLATILRGSGMSPGREAKR
jgi:hypothetical protein